MGLETLPGHLTEIGGCSVCDRNVFCPSLLSIHGAISRGLLLPFHKLDDQVAGHSDGEDEDQDPQLGEDAHLQMNEYSMLTNQLSRSFWRAHAT